MAYQQAMAAVGLYRGAEDGIPKAGLFEALQRYAEEKKLQEVEPDGEKALSRTDRLALLTPALWEVLTSSRLRIVHENVYDTHRERWTTIDVWRQISAAFPTSESTPSLEPFDFCRIPSPDYLFKNGLAGLTSYMALTGFTDPIEAMQTMLSDADDYHLAKSWGKANLNTYLSGKAEGKRKLFNKPTTGAEANAE